MKKYILISLLSLVLLTGCNEKGIKLKYSCNGINKEITVNEKSTIVCDMMGVKYQMKVTKIEDDTIKITTNAPMSEVKDGQIDTNSNLKEFEIKKGKTSLAVPMEGLIQEVTFEWTEEEK